MAYTMTADLVAALESGTRCGAMRFEPALFESLDVNQHAVELQRVARIHHCSGPTAMMIYCTSWGLFQILGMNLYGDWMRDCPALGCDVFTFCQSAIMQHNYFGAFIRAKGIDYSIAQLKTPAIAERFGRVYNGDGKIYGARILAALK